MSKRMLNDERIRRLLSAEPSYDPAVRFTVRVHLPTSYPRRKTGKFLSLSEVSKIVGIKPTTYRRYEGRVFPKAKRLYNGYRVFTNEDVGILRKIWSGRAQNFFQSSPLRLSESQLINSGPERRVSNTVSYRYAWTLDEYSMGWAWKLLRGHTGLA